MSSLFILVLRYVWRQCHVLCWLCYPLFFSRRYSLIQTTISVTESRAPLQSRTRAPLARLASILDRVVCSRITFKAFSSPYVPYPSRPTSTQFSVKQTRPRMNNPRNPMSFISLDASPLSAHAPSSPCPSEPMKVHKLEFLR